MSDFKVIIIGAGLVGALSAISFGKQGYAVELYEYRTDPRALRSKVGRSINLAVSARGIEALRSVSPDLAEQVLSCAIPLKGRMIHTTDGQEQSQVYGLFGETIHSIDRSALNYTLLDVAEALPNVKLFFDHKLMSADVDKHELTFQSPTAASLQRSADLVVGCDGAHSKVRSLLMKKQLMDFSQEYIEHAYLELSIAAPEDGSWPLDPHHLHIWPRKEFMLIALPNPDKSFTATFFAPNSIFKDISDPLRFSKFFEAQFQDALRLITPEVLTHAILNNPVSPLIQVQCMPYHYKDVAILLGDATHAMVPFYGQGMNCGFEDVRVLNDVLHKYAVKPSATWDLGSALAEYSHQRRPDLLAISKLAMDNYTVMRSSVVERTYLIKRAIDNVFGRLFAHTWVPTYSMVSFRDDIPYSQVIKREKRQLRIIDTVLMAGASILGLITIGGIYKLNRRYL